MTKFLKLLIHIPLLVSAIGATPAHADDGEKNVNLKEVQIVASRTTNTANGYVTNLRGSDIAKGKPIDAALELMPGVTKENGMLKIDGLPVSEIYLNGMKLTDTSELSKLPAEMLDKVRVTYLARSSQNAASSGGTISITMRKPPQMGYYGVAFGSARYDKSFGFGNEGLGGMIYSRIKGLSLYDYMYAGWKQYEVSSEQSVPDAYGQPDYIDESTRSHSFDFSNRFSLTQDINSRSSIAAGYYAGANRDRPASKSVLDGQTSTIGKRTEMATHNVTVRYNLTLNDNGGDMTISGDYLNRNTDQKAVYGLDGSLRGNTRERQNSNMWKLSADFVHPLTEKLILQWGGSAQLIDSEYTPKGYLDGAALYGSSTKGFTPIGYAEVSGTIGRIGYGAGVNLQLNRIEYSALGADSHNTQWGIHPTVQLRVPLSASGTTMMRVSYKRMLDDIPFSAISSARRWLDAYNYTVGNPALKAMTTDYANLSLSLLGGKINLGAFYSHIKDWIYWETRQDPENPDIYYSRPVNVKGYHSFGLRAEWAMKPVKFWRFKLTGRFSFYPEDMTIGGVHYGMTRTRSFISFNNNLTFKGGWGGSLNAQIEPTFRTYDRTYHAVYGIDLRTYKYLLKNKMQIVLSGTPLGKQRKLDRHLPGGGEVVYRNTSPVQSIGITVNWWFNGGKKVKVKSIESGDQQYNEVSDSR